MRFSASCFFPCIFCKSSSNVVDFAVLSRATACALRNSSFNLLTPYSLSPSSLTLLASSALLFACLALLVFAPAGCSTATPLLLRLLVLILLLLLLLLFFLLLCLFLVLFVLIPVCLNRVRIHFCLPFLLHISCSLLSILH